MDKGPRIGDLLVEAGLIDQMQLKAALGHQKRWGGKLGKVLVDLDFIEEDVMLRFLADHFKMRAVNLIRSRISPQTFATVPEKLARQYQVVPVLLRETAGKKTIVLAMNDPSDLRAIDEVQFMTGAKVEPVLATDSAIAKVLQYYGTFTPEMAQDYQHDNATPIKLRKEAEKAKAQQSQPGKPPVRPPARPPAPPAPSAPKSAAPPPNAKLADEDVEIPGDDDLEVVKGEVTLIRTPRPKKPGAERPAIRPNGLSDSPFLVKPESAGAKAPSAGSPILGQSQPAARPPAPPEPPPLVEEAPLMPVDDCALPDIAPLPESAIGAPDDVMLQRPAAPAPVEAEIEPDEDEDEQSAGGIDLDIPEDESGGEIQLADAHEFLPMQATHPEPSDTEAPSLEWDIPSAGDGDGEITHSMRDYLGAAGVTHTEETFDQGAGKPASAEPGLNESVPEPLEAPPLDLPDLDADPFAASPETAAPDSPPAMEEIPPAFDQDIWNKSPDGPPPSPALEEPPVSDDLFGDMPTADPGAFAPEENIGGEAGFEDSGSFAPPEAPAFEPPPIQEPASEEAAPPEDDFWGADAPAESSPSLWEEPDSPPPAPPDEPEPATPASMEPEPAPEPVSEMDAAPDLPPLPDHDLWGEEPAKSKSDTPVTAPVEWGDHLPDLPDSVPWEPPSDEPELQIEEIPGFSLNEPLPSQSSGPVASLSFEGPPPGYEAEPGDAPSITTVESGDDFFSAPVPTGVADDNADQMAATDSPDEEVVEMTAPAPEPNAAPSAPDETMWGQPPTAAVDADEGPAAADDPWAETAPEPADASDESASGEQEPEPSAPPVDDDMWAPPPVEDTGDDEISGIFQPEESEPAPPPPPEPEPAAGEVAAAPEPSLSSPAEAERAPGPEPPSGVDRDDEVPSILGDLLQVKAAPDDSPEVEITESEMQRLSNLGDEFLDTREVRCKLSQISKMETEIKEREYQFDELVSLMMKKELGEITREMFMKELQVLKKRVDTTRDKPKK